MLTIHFRSPQTSRKVTRGLVRGIVTAVLVLAGVFVPHTAQRLQQAQADTDAVTAIGPVVTMVAGNSHTCALTAAGGLKCWGLNASGQLGDGTTTQRTTPADVSGLTTGVVAVNAGEFHTCALTAAGGLKCWGDNAFGQLGTGDTTNQPLPADVAGLTSGVITVTAGGNHTCVLTTAGGLKCWGDNFYGQLGDGTTTQRTTPVDVSGLTSGVIAVTAGSSHTCALTAAGGLKCWGRNISGQLGDGSTTQRTTPVDVSGLTTGVVAVNAGGFHTCALTSAGGLKCWGSNDYGQLGDGSTIQRTTPVFVSGLTSGVVAVAAGSLHTCALTAAGGLKCWGRNDFGQLGDGSTTQRNTPVDVSGLTSGVVAVAAGANHTCALTAAGGLKCWGYNGYGQLGDGSTTNRSTPVVTFKADQVIAFAPLAKHSVNDPPFALTATATSGLAVAYASGTPAVCTVAGNTVTIVGVGTCTITASQAGDADFNAAPDVSRSFVISGSRVYLPIVVR